jgi:hypothetical protein
MAAMVVVVFLRSKHGGGAVVFVWVSFELVVSWIEVVDRPGWY